MTDPAHEQIEVARWYTPALRLPKMIGKLPSGERIWGGPYRPVQLGTGFVVAALGVKTMGLWGLWHPIINYVVLIATAAGTAWLMRFIPHGATNPLMIISGGARVATRPTHGAWGRYPVRQAAAVAVRTRVHTHQLPQTPASTPTLEPPAPAPAPVSQVPKNSAPAPGSAAIEDKLAALLTR